MRVQPLCFDENKILRLERLRLNLLSTDSSARWTFQTRKLHVQPPFWLRSNLNIQRSGKEELQFAQLSISVVIYHLFLVKIGLFSR